MCEMSKNAGGPAEFVVEAGDLAGRALAEVVVVPLIRVPRSPQARRDDILVHVRAHQQQRVLRGHRRIRHLRTFRRH